MIDCMFLAIVPAYNEEESIAQVVLGLLPHVDCVVVVDDGSADQTGDRAREAGAVVIRHALNRGQGAAIETGHEYARVVGAEYVVHFDADGQFSPDDIVPALEALKQSGADILFGSRFFDSINSNSPSPARGGRGRGLAARRTSIPWLKRSILLPIARLIGRLFGSPSLTDAHNGFRILNRRALEAVRISQDRMAHATEIPVAARRARLRHIEYPVSVVYREYGQRAVEGVAIVKDLVMGKMVK